MLTRLTAAVALTVVLTGCRTEPDQTPTAAPTRPAGAFVSMLVERDGGRICMQQVGTYDAAYVGDADPALAMKLGVTCAERGYTRRDDALTRETFDEPDRAGNGVFLADGAAAATAPTPAAGATDCASLCGAPGRVCGGGSERATASCLRECERSATGDRAAFWRECGACVGAIDDCDTMTQRVMRPKAPATACLGTVADTCDGCGTDGTVCVAGACKVACGMAWFSP
ncbi:MAG: hypothetical protein H6745_14000 [Deltaproteobacteria bacterium]|nr:hypothetical protein [Deltaproteobacteria bacterium]